MKASLSSENDEQDRELIKLLKELGSFQPTYPSELLAARRAAFVEQIEQRSAVDAPEEFSPEEKQVIPLLGTLKSAEAAVEYPADLLAARRAAFRQQMATVKHVSLPSKIRTSLQNLFQNVITIPSVRLPNAMRTSLVVATLLVAALIGSLLFSRIGQPRRLSASQQVAAILCTPGDQNPACSLLVRNPSQDLAKHRTGFARAAV